MINGWVESNTNNKIKEILKPFHLTQDTRLVLINAIYFKGNWEMQFNKDATKDEDFKISPDKKVKVPMMSLDMKGINFPEFRYVETEDLQALELPYEERELSMLIILPKKSLSDVEKKLNYEMLKSLKQKLEVHPVDVYLPKFKLEKEYPLNGTLISMGMPVAFSNFADFSGMDGTKRLKISDMLHKAFVEVNEEGTEAAAATAVNMVTKVSVDKPKKPFTFRTDHPFIFLIQHNKTGAILFIGRVYQKWGSGLALSHFLSTLYPLNSSANRSIMNTKVFSYFF